MATTEKGIYYPDDYTKSADILADMKQMAESVDKVIQKEKENQETTEQKIEEIDDNQIHITTEKANNINIKDASGQNAKIKLFGISKQGTRSGKNMLVVINVSTTSNGVTITNNGDGSITLNGTATANVYYNLNANNNSKKYFKLINGNTYGILLKNRVDGLSFIARSETKNYALLSLTSGEERTMAYNYETDEQCFAYIQINSGTTLNNVTVYPMLVKGAEIGDYEQYGAMPSPKYSSNIENTTENIDITACNKNFFDENNTNNFKYGVGDDFTTKNNDGTFKTIANFSLGRNKGTKIVGLKANTDYIVSLDIKNITSTATSKAAEVEIIENAEKISIVTQKDFKNLGINTLEFNSGSYQDLSLHISGYTYSEVSKSVSVTFADVLIAEKSNDNSYVAHEQQTITFPLQNQKMMEGSRTEDDGIHHKRKQITLTGNEQIVKYTKTFPNGYGYRVILNDVKANTEVLSSIYNYEKFSNFYWSSDITNKITTHDTTGGYVLVGSSKATIEEFRQEIANSVLEYETEEETIEAYTEAQQTAYNQLQNAKTYKKVTNVFTENAEVEMEYVAHTKTYIDNEINSVKEELNTIKELLSTTTTSAMLLDNMQTDLESEVL